MSNVYIVILLIGILCVLFGGVVGLTVKIYFTNARLEKSKGKRKKEYDRKIQLYKCYRTILVCLLTVSIVANAVYFKYVFTDSTAAAAVDDNLPEEVKVTYNDPKDRLAQNTEGKVKNIFIDYLFFSWFGEEEERTKENYKAKADELFVGKESMSDVNKKLEGKEKDAYDAYVARQNEIDLAKVPAGATLEQVRQGKVLPRKLTVDEYKEEYGLWEKRYSLYPTAANLQQAARSAVDVQTTMMKYSEYEDNWDEIIEYAMHGIQFYMALMLYASAGESKADCCYWIAKIFYDLAEKMPAEYAEYVEHCYLMAYTFAQKGLSYKSVNQQADDHISDMTAIKDKADKALEAYER